VGLDNPTRLDRIIGFVTKLTYATAVRSCTEPTNLRRVFVSRRQVLVAEAFHYPDRAPYINGSSYKAGRRPGGRVHRRVAEELNLHFNSVKYRVARAVARRGRGEIDPDRLDVELALLACHWYGSAVLLPK
jgi:hypothetical protein